MQDFRNLSVWQRARRLTKSVYEMTADFPGSEEFGLKSQMRRATVSICSNIAEGCGRRGDREFRRFLDVAMGSACEMECETILSYDLAFITEAAQDAILDTVIQIKANARRSVESFGLGTNPGPASRSVSSGRTARESRRLTRVTN
jgi:four helix bundle protein